MGNKSSNLIKTIQNTLMRNGGKSTVERQILKSMKQIQKIEKNKPIDFLKKSIINSTPAFNMKNQIKKRKKKKFITEIPFFVRSEKKRLVYAIRYLTRCVKKKSYNNKFYKIFSTVLIENTNLDSKNFEIQNERNKQIVLKKRFLKQFKW